MNWYVFIHCDFPSGLEDNNNIQSYREIHREKEVPFPTMFFFQSQPIDNHLSTTIVTFKSLSHVVIFPGEITVITWNSGGTPEERG